MSERSSDGIDHGMTGPMAFRTEFTCGNCGRTWAREYPSKWSVRRSDDLGQVIGSHVACERMLGQCGTCGVIPCPTCELTKEVTISDREPVDEEVDA